MSCYSEWSEATQSDFIQVSVPKKVPTFLFLQEQYYEDHIVQKVSIRITLDIKEPFFCLMIVTRVIVKGA